MTRYTVTALTAEDELVWLDMGARPGWLVILRRPAFLEHGPRLKEVVWMGVMDPHLSDVTVNEVQG